MQTCTDAQQCADDAYSGGHSMSGTAIHITGTIPPWTMTDRLRKAREMAGLNQEELAEEIGIGRRSVVVYEKGEQSPPRPVLVSWALRTGVDLAWLIGDDPAGEQIGRAERTRRGRSGRTVNSGWSQCGVKQRRAG